jgi:hypothetical protein
MEKWAMLIDENRPETPRNGGHFLPGDSVNSATQEMTSPIDPLLVLKEHHALRHGLVSTTFCSRPLHHWHWACSTAVASLKYLIFTRNFTSVPNPRSISTCACFSCGPSKASFLVIH